MSSILRLVRKRLYCFRFVHLLTAILVAAVTAVALLYQGYVGALTDNFAGRLIRPQVPGTYQLRLPGARTQPNSVWDSPNLNLVIWKLTTRHGAVRMAAVAGSRLSNWPIPKEKEAWLPLSLRGQVYDEAIGDSLSFTYFTGSEWQQAEAKVAGYYEDGGYLSPILVNHSWALSWLGETADQTVMIYTDSRKQTHTELRRYAASVGGASLVKLNGPLHGADYLVSSMYAGGNGAMALGIVFLAIGIGIFGLLVFLDSRSELAVLKALGLKPREAGSLLWLEFLISTLIGLLLGCVSLYWLKGYIGFPLELGLSLLRFGAILVSIAFLLALYAPARLAYVATVNELLLKRPVLLWTQVISEVEGRRPALDDLIGQGWSCLKLAQDEKGFCGTVIPAIGTYVRQGELLAWQPMWFGMAERRYVAPHDGVLQVIDPQRGVLAISKLSDATTFETVSNGGTDDE